MGVYLGALQETSAKSCTRSVAYAVRDGDEAIEELSLL